MYSHINYTRRTFLCLKSFESEGRVCLKDETYTAYYGDGSVKFVFENGDMNFSQDLFNKVVDAWSDVLIETTP